MKKNWKILVFTICIILATNCAFAKEPVLAPDFKLRDLAQNTVVLNSFEDKPVMLFFWTTWCPFCRKELRVLNEKYGELVKEGLEVLAINIEEKESTVNNFIRRNAIILSVLLDEDAAVSQSYEILGVPTYILIDKKGYIVSESHSFPREYKKLISQ